MVAPPDVDRPEADPRVLRFGPTPVVTLPFPTVLVASRDDPYATIQQSRRMADLWGAVFVDLGERGHINAASGLGAWREGQDLLGTLLGEGLGEGLGEERRACSRAILAEQAARLSGQNSGRHDDAVRPYTKRLGES